MINLYELAQCHPGQFKQFHCRELLFLMVECPEDFVKGQEFAQHNCFLYGVSGRHLFYNNENSWLFQQGDTAFLKKGGLGVQKIDNDIFCVLMFYVPDSYLRAFIQDKIELFKGIKNEPVPNHMMIPIPTSQVLRAFFDSVLCYFTTGEPPAEDLIELKFRELLLNILIRPANLELKRYIYKLCLSQDHLLQDVMERNYMYDLSLDQYARLCCRSLASFKRDFQKIYGTTPGRWLIEKKLQTAKRLLLSPEKSIHEVAYESGFKNHTHFSRVFKTCFGSSPLQFRKEQLQIAAV